MVIVEEKIRGVTYLPHGQRCEAWLPAGEWEAVGVCDLPSGRGAGERAPAVILFGRRKNGKGQETWYIGVGPAKDAGFVIPG